MKNCKKCGNQIPSTTKVNGERKSLTARHYCLECSPWGKMRGYELRKADRGYDNNQLIEAIKTSRSIRQVITKLRLVEAGGNYFTIRRKIKELNIDISHFTGQGHLKGRRNIWVPKIPLEEILIENSTYSNTNKLKKRLLDAGVFEKKCYNCNNTIWLGKPIPLELEHRNGDKFDNRKENLTLLCPNCHAFTPTYRRRKSCLVPKTPKIKERKPEKTKINNRPKGNPLWRSFAKTNLRRAERPPLEQLKQEVEQLGYCGVGRKYNVSDNAIKKWIRMYEKYGDTYGMKNDL
jgi:hypothetical protein